MWERVWRMRAAAECTSISVSGPTDARLSRPSNPRSSRGLTSIAAKVSLLIWFQYDTLREAGRSRVE